MTDIQQRLPLKFQTERCSRQSYDIQIADEQTAVPIDWRSPGTATPEQATPEQATPEQASLELGPLELDPLELGTSGAGASGLGGGLRPARQLHGPAAVSGGAPTSGLAREFHLFAAKARAVCVSE